MEMKAWIRYLNQFRGRAKNKCLIMKTDQSATWKTLRMTAPQMRVTCQMNLIPQMKLSRTKRNSDLEKIMVTKL